MSKIVERILYYLVVLFFLIMLITGLILWFSLFSLILIKNDILNLIIMLSVLILIISYFFLFGNYNVLFYKISNKKICDFIETTKYSRFFSIISFSLYNSLLLQIYITSYEIPFNDKILWISSSLPIINIFTYVILINRFNKIQPDFPISKLISLYIHGRLIFMLIKDAKRIMD